MSKKSKISRREFVGAALSAATAPACLHMIFWGILERGSDPGDGEWKEEGVLFLISRLTQAAQYSGARGDDYGRILGDMARNNVDKSIPSMEKLLEANGRMDNFLRLAGKSSASSSGRCTRTLMCTNGQKLPGLHCNREIGRSCIALADKIIKEVVAVQEPSGQLKRTTSGRGKDPMMPQVQGWGHEGYDLGHMIQGSIAYYVRPATGR